MKWINLKNNKCPQCNKDFMKGLKVEKLPCDTTQKPAIQDAFKTMMYHPCGFKITDQRYKEIVSNMTNEQLAKMEYE